MSAASGQSGAGERAQVRTAVVDDHPVVRDGLVAMLGADEAL